MLVYSSESARGSQAVSRWAAPFAVGGSRILEVGPHGFRVLAPRILVVAEVMDFRKGRAV